MRKEPTYDEQATCYYITKGSKKKPIQKSENNSRQMKVETELSKPGKQQKWIKGLSLYTTEAFPQETRKI